MWAAIVTAVAGLVQAAVSLWGPPSEEDFAKLIAACSPLPSPGPADEELADIEKDRAKAVTVPTIPVYPKGQP